jgi:hypothetical protein
LRRCGDPDAARSLAKRRAALKGIEIHGWKWRLKLANEALQQKRNERRRRERMDQLCRPWKESTREL